MNLKSSVPATRRTSKTTVSVEVMTAPALSISRRPTSQLEAVRELRFALNRRQEGCLRPKAAKRGSPAAHYSETANQDREEGNPYSR